jgi:peptide/nickel transport system substrate-binding protein
VKARLAGMLLAFAACDGERGAVRAAARRGTLVLAVTAEPRTLLPPMATDLVAAQLSDLLYERLADPVPGYAPIGDRDYRPALAEGWTWGVDSASLRFVLRAGARWHDGVPVTSRDVRFTYELLLDPRTASPRRALLAPVDSVTTPDERTAVVWCRRASPTLFHDVTQPAHVLPAHLLRHADRPTLASSSLGRRPTGSGRYRLARWDPGRSIELLADSAHPRGAPAIGRVIVRVLPEYQAALAAVRRGEADALDFVRAADVPALARDPRLRVLALPGHDHAYLQLNLHAPGDARRAHALFGDPRLRRAVALAVDRSAIVRNVLGTLGRPGIGPVTRALSTADTTLIGPPHDPRAAAALLDSLGWRRHDGDPVRRRGRTRLSFALLVPTSSATRERAAVLLQAMLATVGIEVRVQRLDHAAMLAALEAGRFDAAMAAFHVDANPAGVREVWGGEAARTGHGFNFGGYASAQVDAALDSAAAAPDAERAARWYRVAYRRIVDDVPAIFLYEPFSVAVVARRFEPAGVRADAWWAGLAEWRVHGAAP